MRIQRNTNVNNVGSSLGAVQVAGQRISQGVQNSIAKSNALEMQATKAMTNVALVTASGLMAGFSGQTTEEASEHLAKGENYVDKGGFNVSEFAKNFIEEAGATAGGVHKVKRIDPRTGEPIETGEIAFNGYQDADKIDVAKNLLDSYNTGIKVGNAYTQAQMTAVLTNAQVKAQEQFTKDIVAGNFNGALERANKVLQDELSKHLADENVTPAVKEKIVEYQNSPLAKAQFNKEYAVKLTNAVSHRNYQEAMKNMSDLRDNLVASPDIKGSIEKLTAMAVSQSEAGSVEWTPQMVEDLKRSFLTQKSIYDLQDPNATVLGLKTSLEDLTSKDSNLSEANKQALRKKYDVRINQIQYHNFRDLGEEVDLVSVGKKDYDVTKQKIETSYKAKEITKNKYLELMYELDKDLMARTKKDDKEDESKINNVETWISGLKNDVLNSLKENDGKLYSTEILEPEKVFGILDMSLNYNDLTDKEKIKYAKLKEGYTNFYNKYKEKKKIVEVKKEDYADPEFKTVATRDRVYFQTKLIDMSMDSRLTAKERWKYYQNAIKMFNNTTSYSTNYKQGIKQQLGIAEEMLRYNEDANIKSLYSSISKVNTDISEQYDKAFKKGDVESLKRVANLRKEFNRVYGLFSHDRKKLLSQNANADITQLINDYWGENGVWENDSSNIVATSIIPNRIQFENSYLNVNVFKYLVDSLKRTQEANELKKVRGNKVNEEFYRASALSPH